MSEHGSTSIWCVQRPAATFSNPDMANTARKCTSQQSRAAQRPQPARGVSAPALRGITPCSLHGRLEGSAAGRAASAASGPQPYTARRTQSQRPQSAHVAALASRRGVAPGRRQPGARQQGRLHVCTQPTHHHPRLTPGPGEYFTSLGLATAWCGSTSKGGIMAQTSREQDLRCACPPALCNVSQLFSVPDPPPRCTNVDSMTPNLVMLEVKGHRDHSFWQRRGQELSNPCVVLAAASASWGWQRLSSPCRLRQRRTWTKRTMSTMQPGAIGCARLLCTYRQIGSLRRKASCARARACISAIACGGLNPAKFSCGDAAAVRTEF